MKIITIQEVEYTAFRLAKETMSWDEPIPEFSSRFPNVLESCLAVPFQKFNNKNIYQGLASKASALFYLMVKNHPFLNGNKRIAISTLLIFLYLNQKWLKVDKIALYNFAVWVAESPSELSKETILAIEKFINNYLVSL